MKTIAATFDDVNRAADAMGALMDHGVEEHNLDLVANMSRGEMLVKRKHNDYADRATEGITTTTTADAVEGAKKGGMVGLAAGALAGLASLVIPGYGLVIGGGALATAIGSAIGAGAAGAAAGGVTGYLVDMGVDQKVAKDIDSIIENGGGLLTVLVSHQGAVGVEKILIKYKADIIDFDGSRAMDKLAAR